MTNKVVWYIWLAKAKVSPHTRSNPIRPHKVALMPVAQATEARPNQANQGVNRAMKKTLQLRKQNKWKSPTVCRSAGKVLRMRRCRLV